MARRKISNAATATLERWLDGFQQGRLHFGELPLAIEAWLHAGYALGRESRQAEIDRLAHECDVLRMYAYTPKERQREYQKRLDRYFLEQDAAFFAAPAQLHTDDDGAKTPERGKPRDSRGRVLEQP